ncbi:hypothetical protein MNBD_GAMMA18-1864 [hydrothermal vent metagenome]|uniref:Cytochrome b561 bacterial/Ni-hydrogenase domain-containing protein n=1 Tax=hydrothermal vent metagenome TaxID=652676 RepID=A0A3B0ZB67_9ZZZZ
MKLKGSEHRYGVIARALHWGIALLLIGLSGLGLYMVELSYYDADYKSSVDLHRSLGVLTALLIMLRMIWARFDFRPPLSADLTPLEHQAATWTHRFFYLLMVLLPIAGYLVSTADGRGVEVFGLFELPALLPAATGREEWAGDLHEGLAIALWLFLVVHMAAAFKHHFFDKNDTLKKML